MLLSDFIPRDAVLAVQYLIGLRSEVRCEDEVTRFVRTVAGRPKPRQLTNLLHMHIDVHH